jgi:hypothetical protein
MTNSHASLWLCSLVVLLASHGLARADDPPQVFSGPQAGEKLLSLKVQLVEDKRSSTTVDFQEMSNGRPTLLVVVNGTSRPAATFTRCLMNYAELYGDELFAGTVYLDADLSAAEQYLRQAPNWWRFGPPLGISLDGPEGPGSYGLNRNVNITVLVANRNTVLANFALIQPSLVDVPKILSHVAPLVDGHAPEMLEAEFLGLPVYQPPKPKRTIAPADPKFRKLICSALAAKDSQAARMASEKLEEFVGSDRERKAILGNCAAFMTDGRAMEHFKDHPIAPFIQGWAHQVGKQEEPKQP